MHTFIEIQSTSFYYYTTNMDPIALALEQLTLDDSQSISAVAKQYQVNRSTLSRRFRNVTVSTANARQDQCLLSSIQESTLIRHLNKLTERSLHPTPAIVRNLAQELAHKEPGKCWTRRFIHRHQNELLSKYLVPMDSERDKATSD